ncbi:MAG: lysophospholipid acyltransferase family protein [bacterium]|nr:lysophospholipid acyltransferase family protein [bacterium]
MAKRGWNQELKARLAPHLVASWLTLVGHTGRDIWLGQEVIDELRRQGKPWIYCFWHCNVTQASWELRNQGVAGLVSASADGDLADKVIRLLGNGTIRGSSSKGGVKALLEMIRWVKSGKLAVITPDGPRGPARKMQSGAITLAAKSGAPLVPFHMVSSRQWVAEKAWDRHLIPKLFSTRVVSLGQPIYVPSLIDGAAFKAIQAQAEEAMNANVERAQAHLDQLK